MAGWVKGVRVVDPEIVSRVRRMIGRTRHATEMPRQRDVGIVLALALMIGAVDPVLAQAPPLNSVPQPPQGSPIERMAPPQLPAVSPGGIKLSPIEEGEVPNVPIAVTRVELVGATLFDAEVRPFLDGLAGPATPLTQLDKSRQEILRYYRSRGYALTSVSLAIDRRQRRRAVYRD